jgi:flavin reductase (DIM6/NTAB) family NADH-FMN oxidoreductase RutF
VPGRGPFMADLRELDMTQRYDLMNQAMVPRPIAWVLSTSLPQASSPVWNLAPFSYFNAVSSEPPVVVLGINSRERAVGLKDTARNLRSGAGFTLSIPSCSMAEAVQRTSVDLLPFESEVAAGGIELADFPGWSVPRVADAKIAFGCVPLREVDLGDEALTVLLSRVERVWISPDVLSPDPQDFVIDLERLDPLARAGRGQFMRSAPFRVPTAGGVSSMRTSAAKLNR